ncbi:MAG: type VI secretion system tip protein VgrG [Lunatimonas sp.]|uniref:type VI secretion system tip protein VgrG n=1 Tax=Lunatimonas sp. TaxID=2060141 RepID=UPI00263B7DC8|nr:type VI secretion system tip protein VgrG [Lunatimonas sp.]MCC5938900.1 type VI secretion system tip protein VgrG [Lunatimonas sp.]
MSSGRLLSAAESMDLVSHTIKVDGTELPASIQVLAVVIHKELNRVPYAKLTILDGDPSLSDFPVSNESLFLPGAEVSVFLGYHGATDRIFQGIVISQRVRIREGGSQLMVECRDAATKMTSTRRSGYFYDNKDSEVMESLITRNGLSATIEDTAYAHPELIQYHCSDWDFMVTRAQANGMVCAVDGGEISIKKPNLDQESTGTASFGSNILEFDAEMDGRNQYPEVNAQGWSLTDQRIVHVEGADPSLALNGNLSVATLAESMKHETLELKHGGKLGDVQLQEWANAKWLFQQLAKTRGRVRVQGVSQVIPGGLITLEGVGDRFSGDVFVSGVFHQFAEGNWTVDIQFGMNPEWFSESHNIHAAPASGLYAAIRGLQTGVVTQLQDDPEAEERIMVRIPIINEQEQGIWCRWSSLDAGSERGMVFRPEIGDEVIVGFINEDPNQAVVLGMLPSSAHPTPIAATDDNHEKGYVSRSGLQLLFDDEKKSVKLETPNGKQITISEQDDVLTLKDDHGHQITLSEDGIALESSKDITLKSTGDIVLEGNNVTLMAQAQFKAEGNSGAEVTTSGAAVLKGSIVQIN